MASLLCAIGDRLGTSLTGRRLSSLCVATPERSPQLPLAPRVLIEEAAADVLPRGWQRQSSPRSPAAGCGTVAGTDAKTPNPIANPRVGYKISVRVRTVRLGPRTTMHWSILMIIFRPQKFRGATSYCSEIRMSVVECDVPSESALGKDLIECADFFVTHTAHRYAARKPASLKSSLRSLRTGQPG